MRAAEGGKEVVERLFVGQVDDCEAQAPLIAVAVKEIIVAHRHVKQIPPFDARRIVVVIFSAGGWQFDERRAVLRGGTQVITESRSYRCRWSGMYTPAE